MTCDVEDCHQQAVAHLVFTDGISLSICQQHLNALTLEDLDKVLYATFRRECFKGENE